MKIYLFYQEKIYNFLLPKTVEGSFGFDIDKNETTKLINVEAIDGKWMICSIEGVNVIQNNAAVQNLPLQNDTFYLIERNSQKFLVYAEEIEKSKFDTYNYENFNMIIGNTSTSNVKYNCPYLGQSEVKIYGSSSGIILEQAQAVSYKNNNLIKEVKTNIQIGDTINIFGFSMIFLNGLILMNNPGGKVQILTFNFGITKYEIPEDEMPRNIQIQDKDLYDKKDYFSKSPRIRRVIETKEINLSPPPQKDNSAEMPLLLTIGPMLTMGVMSMTTIINLMMRLASGEAQMKNSWPQMLTAFAMLISMILWPLITNRYNKKMKTKNREELIHKYDEYLAKKEKEIEEEVHLQKDILTENLITVSDCLNIIQKKNIGFWDKRLDQNDFMNVRIGIGRQPLDIDIQYQEEDFTIDEDELREKADILKERYKYINNVPASYSFYENKITAVMGFDKRQTYTFVNNILLQLLTFYSYEDLKIVLFTNEENKEKWEYIKFLNHNFDNSRKFRFFASDQDSAKTVTDYLLSVLRQRTNEKEETPQKPYYLIIIDDYDQVKRFDFIKELTELDDEDNKVFSTIIIENKLNKLPSKCNNFISLSANNSAVLKNSYEKQEQNPFKDEINYTVNMMNIAKIMSNIPIEFEEGVGNIPDSISFMEMHKVGKVEQLNILNRWNTNDSTMSLKAEIGVDEREDIMYLDLHEKAHGPHGLIAGTTGSGKSEFIITYILSMCINYSPDDIAFILIDYKGGGLALAFENKALGIALPHLAGTITNLDKAEMDRTLVSIDSEVKRRQELFNEAREQLGESTIDIYKYQRFYKEGRLKEPMPHLFIICDEFAELKAQQPDFMDNLISVARIGRSLGVHLILATQKPSGVVNDQIWSNTRFRVCLKVQDEADSKEMLKKPDAAYIKQAGRYYLQVGYDEIYALGQSGYSGAKYYPSNKILKQVDKSINFINDCGLPIKSIQASSGTKGPAQGEQLQAVMKTLIDLSNKVNKKTRRLWLENIPETILIDNLEIKYNYQKEPFHPTAIIGEYDAPEKQEQGKVIYDLLEDGNTAIYGNDGSEREMLLNALIYSLCKNYTSDEINIYNIDYGSEALRRYQNLPQVGGMVFAGDDEKYNNLIKLLKEEMTNRKKLFVDYGGEYSSYIKNSGNKLPLILVIINNYDSLNETDQYAYESLPELIRDSERYGIIYIFTADGISSISRRFTQNLPNIYAYKLKDQYDYTALFNIKTKLMPRDIFGRGIVNEEGVHEFQTAKIIEDENELNKFLQEFIVKQKEINKTKARAIPALPEKIKYSDIEDKITNLSNIPVGIIKKDLNTAYLSLENSIGIYITSNKIANTVNFSKSLLQVLNNIKETNLLIIDPKKELIDNSQKYQNYYTENLNQVTEKIIKYVEEKENNLKTTIFIYNFSKYLSLLDDPKLFTDFIVKMKNNENLKIIIVDDASKLKSYQYEEWIKTAFASGDGIWIGNGITEQTIFKITTMTKEMTHKINNEMGYIVTENTPYLCKLINFIKVDDTNQE